MQGSAEFCRTSLQLAGVIWRGPSCSAAGGLTMEIALYHKRRYASYTFISSLLPASVAFQSGPP